MDGIQIGRVPGRWGVSHTANSRSFQIHRAEVVSYVLPNMVVSMKQGTRPSSEDIQG